MSDINKTLELVRAAMKAQLSPDQIAKAAGWLQSASATSGITYYDLQAPALQLYPVLTPLRNTTPRVVAGMGIQANWRAITGVNVTSQKLGVSQGKRGAAVEHSTADYLAAFRGYGLDDFVNFEADWAAQGFDDAKALAVEGLLRSVMIGEEQIMLGGNTSLALGTANTPTVTADAETTSTCTNGSVTVKVVGLGYQGYWSLAGYNNGATGQTLNLATAEPGTVALATKTNMDGTTDQYNGGVGQISAASAAATIDATHKGATATVTPKPGEFAWAWYVQTAGTGGNYYLYAITTVNKVKISVDSVTTTQPHANLSADHSTCALEFDGYLTLAVNGSLGGYWKALGAGAQLTTDSAGGCTELNALFQDRWNKYRLSPDEIHLNAEQLVDLNALVIKNGGAPLVRFPVDASRDEQVAAINAGVSVKSVLNKITNTQVKVAVHPNVPPGCIFARATQIPYKLSGVSSLYRMLLRQDYYQIAWPVVTRRWEYGVYADGVLQHFFPPALAAITNITPGIA